MSCSRSFALGMLAGITVYVAMQSYGPSTSELDQTIADALKAAKLPAEVSAEAITQLVHRIVVIAPPIFFGIIIFCLSSLVLNCCCGSGEGGAVPVGIPVVYDYGASTTPYMQYDAAAGSGGGGIGVWSDGLCSCTNHGKICLVGVCVPCLGVAQLFERVRAPGSCAYTFIAFAAAGLFVSFVQCQGHQRSGRGGAAEMICELSGTVSSISWIMMVAMVVLVRAAVRARYRIPPSCCGEGLDDCCVSFWCLSLSISQILRHLNVMDGTEYKVASADGTSTPLGAYRV